MFNFNLLVVLKKKISKIAKKDKQLAINFKKKILEVIYGDEDSINSYKNLKSPKNEFKIIHLTDNFILLFKVDIKNHYILFVDIKHWDKAYKK